MNFIVSATWCSVTYILTNCNDEIVAALRKRIEERGYRVQVCFKHQRFGCTEIQLLLPQEARRHILDLLGPLV